jgi:hypothetical protein
MDDSRLALKGADDDTDRGAVLLLVLAVAIVLSLVVLALANFVAADLRYSQVVDSRAKSLSSAESGIEYAVGRMRLNQTLCSSDLASAGPIGLNGAATPTELPATPLAPTEPLNGAVTTLTCERMSADFPGVAGWSVIATLEGSQAIKVDVDADADIVGPIYVSNAGNINVFAASRLMSGDGDVWYRAGTACGTPGVLSNRVVFDEPFARGPICTTATWNQIVSAPPLPDLGALPPRGADGVLSNPSDPNSCLVFEPGRYTSPPNIPSAATVYFRSGDYVFDDGVQEWLIYGGTRVSAGHPGSLTAPSDACNEARDADPNIGGPGATFYFGFDSRIRVDDGGSLEMFPRRQGEFLVSIQELASSNLGTGLDAILRTRWTNSASVSVTVHGLVWAPTNRVVFDNPNASSVQRLLGGVVATRLWIGDLVLTATSPSQDFAIEPASAASDAEILVRSTSTMNGVTTEVEAVVAYRPGSTDLDERVRVTSLRVVD